ncbi:mucin-2-like isoform X2 [Lampris incognitus]|uniref:mucin-2-like isoform X2 n=1 Tax=Lampris incognitus TaxID=2546036 RepID=UPI0024B55188|nr:mucin-2-like isoform X2 [Lampris incognitus]
METQLLVALCALLVFYSGSVVPSQAQAPAAPASSPTDRIGDVGYTEVPDLLPTSPKTAGPALKASLDSHAPPTPEDSNDTTTSNASSGTNAKGGNGTSTVEDGAAVQRLSPPQPTSTQHDSKDNATGTDPPAPPTFPNKDVNLTEQSLPQPRLPPSENHTTTRHTPLTATNASLPNKAHTTTAPILLTAPAQNTQPSTHPDERLHPTSPPSHSNQPSTRHPKSQSTPGHVPSSTSHRTQPETIITIVTEPSLTSSTDPPHEITDFHQPPRATPHGNQLPRASSPAPPELTSAPASNPSAQAKAHADIPSQLNVGGDVGHETPTLDPLLAGLVSAFIITAVIITLLLFLKLRRRDNQPEFRRLQDLPMDDMMEDTPLSMYSY